MQKFLLALVFSFPIVVCGQQLIWTHQPFSEKELPAFRYSQDTVLFSPQAQIGGLIYVPDADKEQPQISLSIKNSQGNEKKAAFKLQNFDPSRLHWHPQIKKRYQYLLKSPHWYYFEISPHPSVVDAQAGVAFLSIIKQASKINNKAELYYKIDSASSYNSCAIDFQTEEGHFAPLWEKLAHYQKLLAKKKDMESQQAELIRQCLPEGFTQISEWAKQSKGLKTDLKDSDLNIFQAIDHLKIITEAIPDSISKNLKRELRALLLLDIAILETSNRAVKAKKNCQKMDLIKQLSLYPELEEILSLYEGQNDETVFIKQKERKQAQQLQQITKLYQPYQAKYKAHQSLQKELDALNLQLLNFD